MHLICSMKRGNAIVQWNLYVEDTIETRGAVRCKEVSEGTRKWQDFNCRK